MTGTPEMQVNEGGWVIPAFGLGTGRTAIRPKDANDVIIALNALGKMKIKRGGDTDKISFSRANVIITLREDLNTESITDAINHPFKIYQTGTWLQFKVMDGVVITTGAPITPTGLETTISVTSGDAQYWIYMDVTTSTATIQNNGTTPTWAVDKIPIGWIDASNTTDEVAIIHQFIHDNVFLPCV